MEAREKRAHVENNGTCGENEKAYSVKSSDELGQLVPVEARPDHVDMNQISIRISTVVQRHSLSQAEDSQEQNVDARSIRKISGPTERMEESRAEKGIQTPQKTKENQ